jgi:hypothetical protein
MDDDLDDVPGRRSREPRLEGTAQDELPAYEQDDGQLSASDLAAIRRAAMSSLPKGAIFKESSLD